MEVENEARAQENEREHLFDDDISESDGHGSEVEDSQPEGKESKARDTDGLEVEKAGLSTSKSDGVEGKTVAEKSHGTDEDANNVDDESHEQGLNSDVHLSGGEELQPDGSSESDDDEERVKAAQPSAASVSLYSSVCKAGESKVSDIAKEWLSSVSIDGPATVAAAVSMVIDAARPGSQRRMPLVSGEAIVENAPGVSVSNACETMASDLPDRQHYFVKRARRAYAAFWQAVVEECDDAILYDTDCFDTILSWLEAMCAAPSRPLRLAASVSAYAIVDGFIAVGTRLRESISTATRQLATEEKRRGPRRTGRLSAMGVNLQENLEDMSAKNLEITELEEKVFTSVFTLKYRDVSPDVRAASISALAGWTVTYPEHYLDDSHSKYIGWLLSDKSPSVRRAALEALNTLARNPKFAGCLQMFLKRFVERIVEMATDKDIDVCVTAVKLCTLLAPFDILPEDDRVDAICDLAASEHAELRYAAGEFVSWLVKLSRSEDMEGGPSAFLAEIQGSQGSATKSKRGRPRKSDSNSRSRQSKPAAPVKEFNRTERACEAALVASKMDCEQAQGEIKEILFTVVGDLAGDTSATIRVLDSVWDFLPSVHCWDAYLGLLLSPAERLKPSSAGSGGSHGRSNAEAIADADLDGELSEDDIASLVTMLVTAAKRVRSVDDSDEGAQTKRRGRKKRQNMEVVDERSLFTTCFLPALPRLISLYQTNERILSSLVELPRYLNASLITTTDSTSHCSKVLAKLLDVLSRTVSHPDVIMSTALTLKILSSTDGRVANAAKLSLAKASSSCGRSIRAFIRAGIEKARVGALKTSLLKAAILSELVELPESVTHDSLELLKLIVDGKKPFSDDEYIGIPVCRLVAGLWMWSGSSVMSDFVEVSEKPSVDDVDGLEGVLRFSMRRDEFLPLLMKLVSPDASGEKSIPLSLRAAAFKSVCLVVSISIGLFRQLKQVSISHGRTGAGGDQLNVPSETLEGLQLHLDESSVSALKACFIDIVDRCIQDALQTPQGVEVPGIHRDARDAVSSLGQIAFLGALPDDVQHLPLLGYVVGAKEVLPSKNDGVSCSDLARLYHTRLRKTLPWPAFLSLESSVLLEAAQLDERLARSLGSDAFAGGSLHVVTSNLVREHNVASPDGSGVGKLMGKVISLFVAKSHPVETVGPDEGEEGEGVENVQAKDSVCRAAGLKIGLSLVGKIPSWSAEKILEKLNNADLFDSLPTDGTELLDEDKLLSELRASLDSASAGRAVGSVAGLIGRGWTRGREGAPRKRSVVRRKRRRQSRQSFDPEEPTKPGLDMSNVRRSGRTRRRTYAEQESESESESEEEETDDLPPGLSRTQKLISRRTAQFTRNSSSANRTESPERSPAASKPTPPAGVSRKRSRESSAKKGTSSATKAKAIPSPPISKARRSSAQTSSASKSATPGVVTAKAPSTAKTPGNSAKRSSHPTSARIQPSEESTPQKRPRGRPRKDKSKPTEDQNVETSAAAEPSLPVSPSPRRRKSSSLQSSPSSARKSSRLASKADDIGHPDDEMVVRRSKRARRW